MPVSNPVCSVECYTFGVGQKEIERQTERELGRGEGEDKHVSIIEEEVNVEL